MLKVFQAGGAITALNGADLTRANLVGADLTGAELSKAVLRDADPRAADLSEATAAGASFSRADLRTPGEDNPFDGGISTMEFTARQGRRPPAPVIRRESGELTLFEAVGRSGVTTLVVSLVAGRAFPA